MKQSLVSSSKLLSSSTPSLSSLLLLLSSSMVPSLFLSSLLSSWEQHHHHHHHHQQQQQQQRSVSLSYSNNDSNYNYCYRRRRRKTTPMIQYQVILSLVLLLLTMIIQEPMNNSNNSNNNNKNNKLVPPIMPLSLFVSSFTPVLLVVPTTKPTAITTVTTTKSIFSKKSMERQRRKSSLFVHTFGKKNFVSSPVSSVSASSLLVLSSTSVSTDERSIPPELSLPILSTSISTGMDPISYTNTKNTGTNPTTSNYYCCIMDIENIRGKTGFGIRHNELLDIIQEWIYRSYIVRYSNIIVVIDHGDEPTKIYCPTAGYTIVFAGQHAKADDVIAIDIIPYLLQNYYQEQSLSASASSSLHIDVITGDRQLIQRCLQYTTAFSSNASRKVPNNNNPNGTIQQQQQQQQQPPPPPPKIQIVSPVTFLNDIEPIMLEQQQQQQQQQQKLLLQQQQPTAPNTTNTNTIPTTIIINRIDPYLLKLGNELLEIEYYLLQKHSNNPILVTVKRRKKLIQKRKQLLELFQLYERQQEIKKHDSGISENNTNNTNAILNTNNHVQIVLSVIADIHVHGENDSQVLHQSIVHPEDQIILLQRYRKVFESNIVKKARYQKETTDDRIILAEQVRQQILLVQSNRQQRLDDDNNNNNNLDNNNDTINAELFDGILKSNPPQGRNEQLSLGSAQSYAYYKKSGRTGNYWNQDGITGTTLSSNTNNDSPTVLISDTTVDEEITNPLTASQHLLPPRNGFVIPIKTNSKKLKKEKRSQRVLQSSLLSVSSSLSVSSAQDIIDAANIQSFPLKIVVISDTHGFEKQFGTTIPDGDILLHLGDFTIDREGRTKEYESIQLFDKWLSTLSHPLKIILRGNHDPRYYTFQTPNTIYITQPITYTIADYNFVFMPYVTASSSSNRNQNVLLAPILKTTTKPCDVLVSHIPPYDSRVDKCKTGKNAGSRTLQSILSSLTKRGGAPIVCLCGHIHEGRGIVKYYSCLAPSAASSSNNKSKQKQQSSPDAPAFTTTTTLINAANANPGIARSIDYKPTVLQLGILPPKDNDNDDNNSRNDDNMDNRLSLSKDSTDDIPILPTQYVDEILAETKPRRRYKRKYTHQLRIIEMDGQCTYRNHKYENFFPPPGPLRQQQFQQQQQEEQQQQQQQSIKPNQVLLAVDLGLRTGISLFSSTGKLLYYTNYNFTSEDELKNTIIQQIDEWEHTLNNNNNNSTIVNSTQTESVDRVDTISNDDPYMLDIMTNRAAAKPTNPCWSITHIAVEGHDASLQTIWKDIAKIRQQEIIFIQPEEWRNDLLTPTERRTGESSKIASRILAQYIIQDYYYYNNNDNDGIWNNNTFSPSSSNNSNSNSCCLCDSIDMAESILLGYYVTRRLSWIPVVDPPIIRRNN